MKGWIVFFSLCALVFLIYHTSLLLHNLSPSLRVVEEKIDISNIEAQQMGYPISEKRKYFRTVVYKEHKQTKGLRVVVRRDTTSNGVYFKDDED